MPNPYRGEVSCDLGGREVVFAMTWERTAEMAEVLGGEAWDDELGKALEGAAKGRRESLDLLARVVSCLSAGEVSPDEVRELSPPLGEVQRALDACARRFYFGAEEAPESPLAASATGDRGANALLRLLGSLRRTASRLGTSGA